MRGRQVGLHGLPGDGEGTRDHRLARDDGRRRRKTHHRQLRPVRQHMEEGAFDQFAAAQHVGSLAEVIDHEAGEDQPKPADNDGRRPKCPRW